MDLVGCLLLITMKSPASFLNWEVVYGEIETATFGGLCLDQNSGVNCPNIDDYEMTIFVVSQFRCLHLTLQGRASWSGS